MRDHTGVVYARAYSVCEAIHPQRRHWGVGGAGAPPGGGAGGGYAIPVAC